jgi:GWxTD domain-containing protein
MKLRKVLAAASVTAALAVSSFAALSGTFSEWGKGPAQFVMTKEEKAAWKKISSDADAQAFVDLFWARRDPTPATPRNEFKEEFDARVKYADDNLSLQRTKGSLTDRGRVLILFGAPSRVAHTAGAGPTGAAPTAPGAGGFVPPAAQANTDEPAGRMVWLYEAGKLSKAGISTAEFVFTDQYGNGQWRLDRASKTNIDDATNKMINSDLVSPNLTEAPKYDKAAANAPAPPPAAMTMPAASSGPAPATSFKNAAYQTAIDEFKAAKTSPYKDAYIYYNEYVAPNGKYYVPVALYVPKAAGLTASSAASFFGVIEDAGGKVVEVIEDPATLTESKDDLFVDKTLPLGSGKYRAILGVADASGKPLVITSSPLELTSIDSSAVGTSKLLLSNNIYELEKAAPPASAFAFGKIKIVPKANRVFSNKDELGYFVELNNPGIDPATNLPKIQTKMEVSGTVAGKPIPPITAPPSETAALPLSGTVGPGQYAIIGTIPFAAMKTPLKPGDYTFSLKIMDMVSKQNYTLKQDFKIPAEPKADSK